MAVLGKPGVGSRNYHALVEFAVFGARKCELNSVDGVSIESQ
jgi:hypothetical protein